MYFVVDDRIIEELLQDYADPSSGLLTHEAVRIIREWLNEAWDEGNSYNEGMGTNPYK